MHTYGLCPVRGLNLGRSGMKQRQLYKGVMRAAFSAGGIVTLDDLSNYTVRHQEPIAGRIDSLGLTVYGPRPPSSGVILQYILRLFDGWYNPIDTMLNWRIRLGVLVSLVTGASELGGRGDQSPDKFPKAI